MVIGVGVDRYKRLVNPFNDDGEGLDEEAALERLGIESVNPWYGVIHYTDALRIAEKEGVVEMARLILKERKEAR